MGNKGYFFTVISVEHDIPQNGNSLNLTHNSQELDQEQSFINHIFIARVFHHRT